MKKVLNAISNEEIALNETDAAQIKGGLLLTCEEKRRTFMGRTYTTQQWSLKSDGSFLLTVKM